MDDATMVSSITSSIQTQSNLLTLLTSQITNTLGFMSTEQLQNICTILGIDYTQ